MKFMCSAAVPCHPDPSPIWKHSSLPPLPALRVLFAECEWGKGRVGLGCIKSWPLASSL